MPGGFSGNGSVEWFVDADNPRGEPVSKKDPKPSKPNRHHQSGVDDFGSAAYEFVVSIKIPNDVNARRELASALGAATRQVENAGGGAISFTLPVEDKDHGGPTKDQILIDWRPAASVV
ncbi:MAG TPA: hypothetical protein VM818_21685 [Vicinamibacterales bacterium]|nr:hypothetical protein [Vicinamibacterales bacterium]